MKKWIKGSLLIIAGLLLTGGLAIAYLTHDFTWSVDSWIYGQMFRSMPKPPGSRAGLMDLTPYHLYGSSSYFVDTTYAETVDFFVTEFPRSGWGLVDQLEGESEYEFTKMFFAHDEQYWLCVWVIKSGQGNEQTRETLVDMRLSKDKGGVFGHCH